jgi:hypothetical protein
MMTGGAKLTPSRSYLLIIFIIDCLIIIFIRSVVFIIIMSKGLQILCQQT